MKILAMLKLDPALLRPLQDHQRGATRIPRKAVGSSRVQNGECKMAFTAAGLLPVVVYPHDMDRRPPGPRKRAEIRPGWR